MDRSVGGITIENHLKTYCVTLNDLNTVLTAKSNRDGFILIRLNVQTRQIEHEFFVNSRANISF